MRPVLIQLADINIGCTGTFALINFWRQLNSKWPLWQTHIKTTNKALTVILEDVDLKYGVIVTVIHITQSKYFSLNKNLLKVLTLESVMFVW